MMATRSEQDTAGRRELTRVAPSLLVCPPFREALAQLGLVSLDAIFAFEPGRDLVKPSIGRFRRRLQFEVTPAGSDRPVKVFLKRYDRPPILRQLSNWLLHHRRAGFAGVEQQAADRLAAAGIKTPRIVACGEQWGALFERRSFLMVEEVKDSCALERRLPPCFDGPATAATRQTRCEFIRGLALFIRRFHETGYRHRDLYLSHIFCKEASSLKCEVSSSKQAPLASNFKLDASHFPEDFCLIDLARASRPILQRRFQVKDLAQLHYSTPARHASRTDRLRFLLAYLGRRRLLPQDKAFARGILRKTGKMTRHNIRHGAVPPYLTRMADGR